MAAVTPSDARVFVLDVGQHMRLFGRLFRRIGSGVVLVLVLFQTLWWWASSGTKYPDSALVCALTLLALVATLAVFTWLLLWRLFSNYRLLLGPDWLAVDSRGRFRQQLKRDEVQHVCEVAAGLVLVRQRGAPFRVPRSINGYDRVRSELLAWAPLAAAGSADFRPWLGLVAKLAILVASLLLVGLCALLLVIVNTLVKFVVFVY